jgi:hypothetical protein
VAEVTSTVLTAATGRSSGKYNGYKFKTTGLICYIKSGLLNVHCL